MAEMNNIPYRRGIEPPTRTSRGTSPGTTSATVTDAEIREESPHFSSDKSRGGGGTSCINARKQDHAKRDLRGLQGKGNINWGCGDEEKLLTRVFQDAGGVPQQTKVGQAHGGQRNCSLDQSKGAGPQNDDNGEEQRGL